MSKFDRQRDREEDEYEKEERDRDPLHGQNLEASTKTGWTSQSNTGKVEGGHISKLWLKIRI
jgi:hypothetical protein